MLQAVPLSVNELGAAFVPFQEARKPSELSVEPAGIEPSYDRLVMVT
jgi:hypothetical protein